MRLPGCRSISLRRSGRASRFVSFTRLGTTFRVLHPTCRPISDAIRVDANGLSWPGSVGSGRRPRASVAPRRAVSIYDVYRMEQRCGWTGDKRMPLGSANSRPSLPAPADTSDLRPGPDQKAHRTGDRSIRDAFQNAPKRLAVAIKTPDGLVMLETLGAQRYIVELLDLLPKLFLGITHIAKHRTAVRRQHDHHDTARERHGRQQKHACLQWQPGPSGDPNSRIGSNFGRRTALAPSKRSA